jgi:hypothetical protein
VRALLLGPTDQAACRKVSIGVVLVRCGVAAAIATGLLGCAHQTYWNDVTGQRRGQSQFTVESGRCQLMAQRAGNDQQALVNQQNVNGCTGTKAQCGTVCFLQGLSVGSARNEAYSARMQAHGWTAQQARY